ncbi:MARVEL domain-containing protein 1-like [Glandiceps talaboti]
MDTEKPANMDEPVYDPAYTSSQAREQTPRQQPTPAQFGAEEQRTPDVIYMSVPVNLKFMKSPAGILKVVEMVFGLIVWACVVGYLWKAANGWVFFVSFTLWLLTIVNYIIFLFNVSQKLSFVHWGWEELIFNGVSAVLIFTAAVTESVIANGIDTLVAACVFLWFNFIAYSIGAVLAFRQVNGKWPWENHSTTAGDGSSWSTEQQTSQRPTAASVETPPAYDYDANPKY